MGATQGQHRLVASALKRLSHSVLGLASERDPEPTARENPETAGSDDSDIFLFFRAFPPQRIASTHSHYQKVAPSDQCVYSRSDALLLVCA